MKSNIETLENLCHEKVLNIDKIKQILDDKVKPTTRCFLGILGKYDAQEKLTNINDIKILSSLLSYGYNLTQTDFYILTNMRIYVSEYKDYGLVIDDYVIHACEKNLFFPYPEVKICKEEILELFRKTPTLNNLKSLMKQHNFVPDANYAAILFEQKIITKTLNTIYFIFNNYVDFAENFDILYDVFRKNNRFSKRQYRNDYAKIKILRKIIAHLYPIKNEHEKFQQIRDKLKIKNLHINNDRENLYKITIDNNIVDIDLNFFKFVCAYYKYDAFGVMLDEYIRTQLKHAIKPDFKCLQLALANNHISEYYKLEILCSVLAKNMKEERNKK